MPRLRAAKALTWIDFRVVPCVAAPGEQDRVLAIGAVPDFVCDFILIGPTTPIEQVADAIEWVLGEREDPDATTVADVLGVIFGGVARELTPEDLAAEDALRRYQLGLD